MNPHDNHVSHIIPRAIPSGPGSLRSMDSFWTSSFGAIFVGGDQGKAYTWHIQVPQTAKKRVIFSHYQDVRQKSIGII